MSGYKKAVEDKGLTLAFRPGEMIPWKKIWFRVESVEKDRITLIPMHTTAGFAKENGTN